MRLPTEREFHLFQDDLAEWRREMRKQYGWRAGLRLERGADRYGRGLLLYRHWPFCLCWAWIVRLTYVTEPAVSRKWWRRYHYRNNSGVQWGVGIGNWSLTYSSQKNDQWMVGGNHSERALAYLHDKLTRSNTHA